MPYVLLRRDDNGRPRDAVGPFDTADEAADYARGVGWDREHLIMMMYKPRDDMSAATLAELLESAERQGFDGAAEHYAQRLAARIEHDAAHLTPSEHVDLFHAELSAARERRAGRVHDGT